LLRSRKPLSKSWVDVAVTLVPLDIHGNVEAGLTIKGAAAVLVI